MQERATEIIQRLRNAYTGNPFQFDAAVGQFVTGEHNKKLRQEIIYQVTGDKKPVTKCAVYAVSTYLKNSFDQLSLF